MIQLGSSPLFRPYIRTVIQAWRQNVRHSDASAAKLRAYLVNLRGWVGANGPYDFRAAPQRGIGERNVVMVRWDAQRGAGAAVSKFGGAQLPK